MRFFAQADEVFDGDQSARKAEDHVDRDEASELKPGEGRAVHAEPQRLTYDDIRFGGNLIGKSFVKEVDDGQDGACKRHEGEDEKSPAGPDVGKRLRDDVIETAPADEDEDQRRDAKGFEFELFIH